MDAFSTPRLKNELATMREEWVRTKLELGKLYLYFYYIHPSSIIIIHRIVLCIDYFITLIILNNNLVHELFQ